MSFFQVTHTSSETHARTGSIQTAHGTIETPCFMPVGTQATVKTLDAQDVATLDPEIILANTYHLHLRPGEDIIDKFGGLHTFMNWHGPMLTDSGGFQVFSLAREKEKNEHTNLVTIDDDGVTFRSHIDGSSHRFTPQIAMDIQHKLGADIIMAWDECTPDTADESYAKKALDRTHRWAEESIAAHKKEPARHGYPQYLFGIIQGAHYRALREASARAISSMDFDGIAIGGESIGYNMDATKDIVSWVMPLIPENKPRYTMGVGYAPTDLFTVVEAGIDMFDCVAPTRIARNGALYVSPTVDGRDAKYTITITKSRFKEDRNPIDPLCTCYTCTTYSRSYIHHLFKAEELLAYRLATIHNLHFLLDLMRQMRAAIKDDRFLALKAQWTNNIV